MAVVSSQPTVLVTAVKLADNPRAGVSEQQEFAAKRVTLKNKTATASVFLGPSGVTTGNGYEWAATGENGLTVTLEPGEELWGIVAAVNQVVHVLITGR